MESINYSLLIKQYREKMFLTQKDLAEKLNVSYVTISRWEQGDFKPTMKTKKKLYKLFSKANLVE